MNIHADEENGGVGGITGTDAKIGLFERSL